MKIAPLSTIGALSASAASCSGASSANDILPDEAMIILGTGALGALLPTNGASAARAPIRDLATSGGGYYCGGAPICNLMYFGGVCYQETTCPSNMNACRASCGGLCYCKSQSLGCTGGYNTPMSCLGAIDCEAFSPCSVLTNAADCGTIPGCQWTPGSPGSSGGSSGGTSSSACYSDYDAIWESTELQNAAGAAVESCEEKVDEESNRYTATCPEANPSFVSACASRGGVLRYNNFNHECGGVEVVIRNFPWCMSPSCSEEEQRNVDRYLEDGLMGVMEKETGLQCVDKPNLAPAGNPSGGGGVNFPSGSGVNIQSAAGAGGGESSTASSLASSLVMTIVRIGSALAAPGITSLVI